MHAGSQADRTPETSLGTAWCVAALLVAAGGWLQASELNRWLLAWLQAHTPAWPALWSALTVLGLGWSAWIIVAALDRRSGRALALLLPCLLIGGVLTHLPKWLLATARPAAALPLSELQVVGEPIYGGGAMPSGHALTAFAVLALLWLAMPLRRLWHAAGLLLAVLIAWSRLAVGAHWPADLLAGAGLGLVTALLAYRLMAARLPGHGLAGSESIQSERPELTGSSWFTWWASVRGQRAAALTEMLAGLALLFTRTGYPQGRPMQLALALLALASAMLRMGIWRRMRTMASGWVAMLKLDLQRPEPALHETRQDGLRSRDSQATA